MSQANQSEPNKIVTEQSSKPCSGSLPMCYWTDGKRTIYHGDCRAILPLLPKADLCLTDPPYGINLNTDNSRFSGGHISSIKRRGNSVGPSCGRGVIGDDDTFDPSFLLECATD